MALLYLVAAWLIMQVAEVVIGLASLPAWVGLLVLAALAIGFPITLIVSWFYEVTPQGLALEKDVTPRDSIAQITGRRIDFIVIAVLAAAVILFAAHTWWPTAPTDKSVAVLAFENLSGDPTQEYFSDGISEELLNALARIEDLRVISRASSFSFKGKDLDTPSIARALNVAHVLEGSVRRMGNNVRITAQLIDADTDSHVWSERFDRELTTQNIFSIQSEIAAAIAAKLQATFSEQDQVSLGNAPTQSLEAYQAYLLGKQRMISRATESLEDAREYFEKAIAADPAFALAYVGLAETYMLLGDYAGRSLDDVLASAEPALRKALALDDELVEAYVAIGAIRAKANDLGAAVDAFQRALVLDSNYAKAYHWYGDVLLNNLQQPEIALPLLEKAYTLDPVSPALIVTIGQAHSALGRLDKALEYYGKALEIEPAYASSYFLIGSLHAYGYGRLDQAIQWSLDGASHDPRYAINLSALGAYYLALGDAESAEYWVNQALSASPDRFFSNRGSAYLSFYAGNDAATLQSARKLQRIVPGNNATLYLLAALGQYEELLESSGGAYPELVCDPDPEVSRLNLFPAINRSLALEKVGDRECAARLLEKALDQMQRMPRLGFFGYGIADVEVYARQGKPEQALAVLRQAIDAGYRMPWWTQAERSPHTELLRDDLQFQAMMEEIRVDLASQLERVRHTERRSN